MSISVKQRLALVGAGLLVAMLAAACPGELENAECFAPDSCCDVPGSIIAPNCATANCHDSITKYSGLDLTNDAGLASRLLNVAAQGPACKGTLIDAANPDASLMYTLCTASPTTGCQKMPFGKAQLSSAQVACIRQWIGEVAGEQPTGSGATTSM